MFIPPLRFLAPMLAAFALSGCGIYDSMKEDLGLTGPDQPCPRVMILADAAAITQFAPGAGQDLIDVVLDAEMIGFRTVCSFNLDDDGSGEMRSKVQVRMALRRGAAATGRTASLDYFVAIADLDKTVLAKQVLAVQVAFPANSAHAEYTDEAVDLVVPLAAGQRSRDFEIYVGYQLSPEQMEYNRQRRGR